MSEELKNPGACIDMRRLKEQAGRDDEIVVHTELEAPKHEWAASVVEKSNGR